MLFVLPKSFVKVLGLLEIQGTDFFIFHQLRQQFQMQWDRQEVQLFGIEQVCIQTEAGNNFTYSFRRQSLNSHGLGRLHLHP